MHRTDCRYRPHRQPNYWDEVDALTLLAELLPDHVLAEDCVLRIRDGLKSWKRRNCPNYYEVVSCDWSGRWMSSRVMKQIAHARRTPEQDTDR